MITTLFAIGVAGGKLKTEYLVLSVSAAAIEALRVVIAVISPPLSEGLGKGLGARVHAP
jgi:hypothetical protein